MIENNDLPIEELIQVIMQNTEATRKNTTAVKKFLEVSEAQPNSSAMLSTAEVAKILKVSQKTIRNYIAKGQIRALKLNGGRQQDRYFIYKESVECLLRTKIHMPLG